MSTQRSGVKQVTFRIDAPGAGSVALVGDFNGWDPERNPMRQRKDGVWWTTVRLNPGTCEYKFVVDGADWRNDPLNPNQAPNSFGSVNSVCEIG